MSSSMFRCEYCSTTMTGAEPYKTHIEGKKHIKKLKTMGIVAGSTSINNHDPSDGHVAKPVNHGDTGPSSTAQSELMDTTSNNDPVMNAVKANMLGTLPLKRQLYEGRCQVCNVEYTSKSHEDQHLSGKKHEKKAKAKQQGVNAATFYCGFCNIHVNSVEQMDQHRTGTSHHKKVANARKSQQELEPEHSGAKRKFVPSSGDENRDSQVMPPPPLPPLEALTYDK